MDQRLHGRGRDIRVRKARGYQADHGTSRGDGVDVAGLNHRNEGLGRARSEQAFVRTAQEETFDHSVNETTG